MVLLSALPIRDPELNHHQAQHDTRPGYYKFPVQGQ